MTAQPNQTESLNERPEPSVPSLNLDRWAMEVEEFVRDVSAELADIVTGLADSYGENSAPSRNAEMQPSAASASEELTAATPSPAEPPATGDGPCPPEIRATESLPIRQTGSLPIRQAESLPPRPAKPESPEDSTADAPGSSRLQSLMDRLEAVRLTDPQDKDQK